METAFHYGLVDKQLGFKLREKLTTPLGFAVKGNGLFNTVTGTVEYKASVKKKKNISLGERIKDAGSTPLTLGMGLGLVSEGPREPHLTLVVKKKLAVLDGPNTVASAKVVVDSDLKASNITKRASIKLSHKALNFTQRQDLKVTAGVDLTWPEGSNQPPKTSPIFQVRENNWGVHYRNSLWSLTYDL